MHTTSISHDNLYEVKIGKRRFKCIRQVCGGGLRKTGWSEVPVSDWATEAFFLKDGRQLLWRRYNGMIWSRKGAMRDSTGIYEDLAEAGMPCLNAFGEKHYLWYDQIPEYALNSGP